MYPLPKGWCVCGNLRPKVGDGWYRRGCGYGRGIRYYPIDMYLLLPLPPPSRLTALRRGRPAATAGAPSIAGGEQPPQPKPLTLYPNLTRISPELEKEGCVKMEMEKICVEMVYFTQVT
jgi:hypothetical protein